MSEALRPNTPPTASALTDKPAKCCDSKQERRDVDTGYQPDPLGHGLALPTCCAQVRSNVMQPRDWGSSL